MKKILLLIFVIQSSFAFVTGSDTLKPKNTFPFWTIGINGGLIAPLGNFGNLYDNSASAGFEIEFHPIHRLAFFFNPQYDFLSSKDLTYNGTAGYVELGAGAKLFLGKASETFFVEAGIGDYFYFYTSNIANNSKTNIRGSFGVKGGVGANIFITKKLLAFIKTDIHLVFTPVSKTYYPGLYGGLRFII